MKIIEDSFINLILPLYQAQQLNSLICRKDISQAFFQLQKTDTNPFPNQEKFEDELNTNSNFCSTQFDYVPLHSWFAMQFWCDALLQILLAN